VTRACLAGLVLALVVLANASAPGQAAAARVSIAVTLGAGKNGTFRMTGSPTDAGRVVAARRVSGGRLLTTQTLSSARGKLLLSSSQACARRTGTWRVVSGTGVYAGATGGGTTSGRIGCGRPFKRTTVVHAGSLLVPPPPLASPGVYGGRTAQGYVIQLEVAPNGRSVSNVLLGGYQYDCVSESGLRTSVTSEFDVTASGPFAIGEDRSFRVEGRGPQTTTGSFTAAGVAGTITIQYPSTDYQGKPSTCAGQIAWTATTPAPPLPSARAGKYCGVTTQGEGVCLDVPAGGRELRSLTVGVPLDCGGTGFLVRLTIDGPLPIRTNLSFRSSYTQSLGDEGSALTFVSGTFDETGSMSGRITLQQPVFTYQGTRYTCRNGNAAWTAKLQS
jgi:hypothetical protein